MYEKTICIKLGFHIVQETCYIIVQKMQHLQPRNVDLQHSYLGFKFELGIEKADTYWERSLGIEINRGLICYSLIQAMAQDLVLVQKLSKRKLSEQQFFHFFIVQGQQTLIMTEIED